MKGRASVEEIPPPSNEDGCLLIHVDHSCISIGTELSGMRASAVPQWKRLLNQPGNMSKVYRMVSADGIAKTRQRVKEKLTASAAIGYSAAGIVMEVGVGIEG